MENDLAPKRKENHQAKPEKELTNDTPSEKNT